VAVIALADKKSTSQTHHQSGEGECQGTVYMGLILLRSSHAAENGGKKETTENDLSMHYVLCAIASRKGKQAVN